jgi:molybdopterin synthase sulfur carrier subunit
MSVKVNIHSDLQNLTNGQAAFEVTGGNVGECLSGLMKQFPGFKEELLDKRGNLSMNVDVLINMESSYPEELARTVHDGDEIIVMPLRTCGG